jgi:hypothetical protein
MPVGRGRTYGTEILYSSGDAGLKGHASYIMEVMVD